MHSALHMMSSSNDDLRGGREDTCQMATGKPYRAGAGAAEASSSVSASGYL